MTTIAEQLAAAREITGGRMSTAELKPCPFCGSDRIEADFGDESACYRCRNCGVQSGRVYFTEAEKEADHFTQSEADALDAWNRRQSTTPAQEPAQAAEPVTDAMVEAYLKANDAYWRETDELPKAPGKWRNGTPREATRVSLAAALAAAPHPSEPAATGQFCCIHAWSTARQEAWKARDTNCGCDHVEYCAKCFPPEHRPGGAWDQCKPVVPTGSAAPTGEA